MRVMLIISTLMLSSSSAYAACYTNAMGRVVCNNEQRSTGYNANRGTTRTSETNHGVTTTQTSGGGEAKTKNGKGVYTSPSGQKCYKTANNSGCR
jgi:hypothetical protein